MPARPSPVASRLVAAFAVCLAVWMADATAASARVPLRLIGLNDFHGNLEAGDLSMPLADPGAGPDAKAFRVPVGGAAANAGLVAALRAGVPHSLLLSAGDLFGASPLVSTLFRHESTVAVMNAIGLEVDVVGNHEFDAGFSELQRVGRGGCAAAAPGAVVRSCAFGAYAGARFPLVSANVLDAATGRPVLAPYVVKRFDGVPVGIVGAVTRSLPTLVSPSGISGLRVVDEAEGVNRAARELRAQGVRAIVAVFHEGGELGTSGHRGDWNDTTCADRHGPIFDIAARLAPEISVVFSGHTHQGYRCIVDGRTILSGTFYGRGLSVVDVELDRKTGRIVAERTRSRNLPVVNDRADAALRERVAAGLPSPWADAVRAARPDAEIAAMVARAAEAVAPTVERPVGTIGGTFGREGPADTAAGRLVADAQLAATRDPAHGGARIALTNPGGIRSTLDCRGAAPPCAVTFGQLFTMQPFGNDLVVMTLSGAQLKALLESQHRSGDAPKILQPSASLTYVWQSDAAAGDQVRELRVDGEPVLADRPYRVAVNSFLADGGDGFAALRAGTERVVAGSDIDAMLDYLKPPAERVPVPTPRVTWRP